MRSREVIATTLLLYIHSYASYHCITGPQTGPISRSHSMQLMTHLFQHPLAGSQWEHSRSFVDLRAQRMEWFSLVHDLRREENTLMRSLAIRKLTILVQAD